MILNRETEIAKALWSPGIYHRALGCSRTLKLKSGGLILRLYRGAVSSTFSAFSLAFIVQQHVSDHISSVKLILTHTHDGITDGKSRIIGLGLYSYETNYRDSVRGCSESLHSASPHRRGRNYLHVIAGNFNQVSSLRSFIRNF